VLTPQANLRDRSFWITRDEEADTFNIRISRPRRTDTEFGWLLVEME